MIDFDFVLKCVFKMIMVIAVSILRMCFVCDRVGLLQCKELTCLNVLVSHKPVFSLMFLSHVLVHKGVSLMCCIVL